MNRTVGHRGRLAEAAAAWFSLTAASLLLAGCAAGGTATSVEGTTGHSSAISASGAGSATTGSDRLTETVTYGEGQERFDPLPASYRPKITAGEAFAAFAKEGDPRSLGTDERPTILLASYTNFVTGQRATLVTGTMDPVAAAKSDEASKPWWVGVPVWYIRYLRVPAVSLGAPVAPGQAARPPVEVVQEMVIPVSAETGKVLVWENTRADRTPTSYPRATG